jgi:hypothetical protein
VGANHDAFPRIGPKRRDHVSEGVKTLFCHREQIRFLAGIEPHGKVWRNSIRLFGYYRTGEFELVMDVGSSAVQILGMRAIPGKECLGQFQDVGLKARWFRSTRSVQSWF